MFNKTKKYEEEILLLASILDKLWKIIHHSDPSADEKKSLFYEKYMNKIERIANKLLIVCSWEEVQKEINTILSEHRNLFEKENLQVIEKKLKKDFQSFYVKKPVFQEFKQEKKSSEFIKPRAVKRKYPPLKKKEDAAFTKDSLMDMVKLNKEQRKAKNDLMRVVEKIREIGPEKIEKRINSLMRLRSN